ncbi:MAG: hypothetical protein U0804_01535 [Gemmataceae bacterium]
MANGNRTKAAPEAPEQRDKPRPVHEVRLGRVKAAVWANEGEHGVRYSVTVCRVYKDQQQKWQTTESFGRDDLLVLAKVVDMAHTWVSDNQKGQDVPA